MPRQRMIHPEFWTDGKMLKLPIRTRLFYIGLWQFADDYGHLEDDPEQLQVLIFPGGCQPVDPEEVNEMLAELLQCHRLSRYEADGKKCLSISFWDRWQHIERPSRPRLPFPIDTASPSLPQTLTEGSPKAHRTLSLNRIEVVNRIRELGNKGSIVPKEFIFPEGWNENVKEGAKILLSMPAFLVLAQKDRAWFIEGFNRFRERLGDRDAKEVRAELWKFQEWWADKPMKKPWAAITNWFFKVKPL